MFDSLGLKLQDSLQKLRGQKTINEKNIDDALSEIRRSLLEADVSLKVVKLFTSKVREKALGSEVLTGIKPGEQLVKIINDELTAILGGDLGPDAAPEMAQSGNILLLGLQGAGKTTTAAKLAYKFKNEGLKPLLIPCDLQRPAAIKQLKVLSEQAQVDFFETDPESKLLDEAKKAMEFASQNGNEVLIFDTAGRLQVDTDLMAELFLLEKLIKPAEKILVIDSLIGQEAANVADTFNTQIGLTGVILTKLDSDSRGGAALSVVEATGKPIKLASVGEKLEDLEIFHPDRMASRILGMGDVLSLVEKAEQRISEEESKRLEEELMKGNFNYETFMTFQNMISKLGDFSSMFKMMGMGSMLSQMGLNLGNQDELAEQSEKKFSKYKIVINSMTKEERKKPELLSSHGTAKSRRARITKGSGMQDSDISHLTAEFNKMAKMFKNLGPMLSMMQSGDQDAAAAPQLNPMDMMGQMMGGMSKKQQKAMRASGMVPGKSKNKEVKKAKKGAKPGVKGFKS